MPKRARFDIHPNPRSKTLDAVYRPLLATLYAQHVAEKGVAPYESEYRDLQAKAFNQATQIVTAAAARRAELATQREAERAAAATQREAERAAAATQREAERAERRLAALRAELTALDRHIALCMSKRTRLLALLSGHTPLPSRAAHADSAQETLTSVSTRLLSAP